MQIRPVAVPSLILLSSCTPGGAVGGEAAVPCCSRIHSCLCKLFAFSTYPSTLKPAVTEPLMCCWPYGRGLLSGVSLGDTGGVDPRPVLSQEARLGLRALGAAVPGPPAPDSSLRGRRIPGARGSCEPSCVQEAATRGVGQGRAVPSLVKQQSSSGGWKRSVVCVKIVELKP